MRKIIEQQLAAVEAAGNLRIVPGDASDEAGLLDLSSNDYLGIASRTDLVEEFFATRRAGELQMSSAASRLLSGRQRSFEDFERFLQEAYGRAALVFNSGYHANVGIVQALGSLPDVTVVADRLVHASIIDGIRLSGAPFERFRHNDYNHLARLASKVSASGRKVLIIAESVYSMDGDKADIEALAEVKRSLPGAMLYVDEAHAVGVEGQAGLGLCYGSAAWKDVDVVIGTLGKALGSAGAFAVVDDSVKSFLVNRARSFIFSTALPPLNIEWSRFVFAKAMAMDSEREALAKLGKKLGGILAKFGGNGANGHIQPLMAGAPERAMALSAGLRECGFKVLPIRTPTVPPGTDRLRFSLSADIDLARLDGLENALRKVYGKEER